MRSRHCVTDWLFWWGSFWGSACQDAGREGAVGGTRSHLFRGGGWPRAPTTSEQGIWVIAAGTPSWGDLGAVSRTLNSLSQQGGSKGRSSPRASLLQEDPIFLIKCGLPSQAPLLSGWEITVALNSRESLEARGPRSQSPNFPLAHHSEVVTFPQGQVSTIPFLHCSNLEAGNGRGRREGC